MAGNSNSNSNGSEVDRFVTHTEFTERMGSLEKWLRAEFGDIKATMADQAREAYSRGRFNPAWLFAGGALLVAVIGASASGVLFAVQAFVSPVATAQVGMDRALTDMVGKVDQREEMTVRNDERWRLWLNGNLLALPNAPGAGSSTGTP